MTVASEVNQCLASLKSIESSLSALAMLSQNNESRLTLHEAMMTVSETAADVQKRAGELEREEQYKGY
ncbi:DUF1657 domain-containing protein [Domibacillus sp. A3M-37]|uniref:DUF1657 domain-containing protein n=1 Tax=Domibacillus TaxID=1433999 RepID=UPI0006183143|nr:MULTISPECIES: DUF1657 domain-containing protein [Domibacillus]MCP3761184.1 DUF1657 domain-containing protein [Domibacillus sp. A3M-37]